MKKSKLKHLAAASFALCMMSTLTVTASAATCPDCGSDSNFRLMEYNVSVQMVTPDVHCLEMEVEYICYGCKEHFFVDETVVESHDYHLEYDTNMLVCDRCGDSYSWK